MPGPLVFFLTLSILSIPLETSEIGKTVRNEFKNLGIDTAKYDLIANNGRSLSYLLIVGGIISQIQGLIMAYGITIYMLILAVWKYTQVIKIRRPWSPYFNFRYSPYLSPLTS